MTYEKLPTVSIVVATHNRADWLVRSLPRILALDYPAFEVIVVDDGSEDDTPALMQRWAARGVRSLRHSQARGASAARNTGIAAATGELVAFIDDDAVPEPDWLRRLVAAYTDESVGAVGGAVYHLSTGTPQCTGSRANRFGRDRALSPSGDLGAQEFLVLIECNMSVRRRVLEQVGGFDPAIRIYGEGVDLCIRIARAGYGVLYTPSAIVWHAKAAGPFRNNLYHPYRNRIYLSLKNFGSSLHLVELFLYDSAFLLGNVGLQLYWLMARRATLRQFSEACRQMVQARVDGYADGLRAWRTGVGTTEKHLSHSTA